MYKSLSNDDAYFEDVSDKQKHADISLDRYSRVSPFLSRESLLPYTQNAQVKLTLCLRKPHTMKIYGNWRSSS
jgi:hypothetical protein